ncbi:MAG: AhpC/TSA family protein [Paenibacillus sp.]|nr:AhpC/TSA family protein [Paenibacillus sp.]
MKHLQYLASLALSAAITANVYASEFDYTVSGDLGTTDLDGQKAYLMLNDNNHLLDSAVITNGRFTINGHSSKGGWARVDAGREYACLIVTPSTIEVDFINHAPLSGDSVNMAYREHRVKVNSLESVIRELIRYHKTYNDTIDVKEKMAPMLEAYLDYMVATIRNNPDNAISEAALRSFAMQSTPEQWKELYPTLPPFARDLSFTRRWDEKMTTALRARPGSMFVDIEGKNIDGTPAKLSDYVGKGKYILVDFWASWCGPCRAEGKETLIPLYEKYGDDPRFEIVGVGTWDDPKRTLKSIGEEGYKWPQIIDAGMKPMEAYGFDGIPMIMLFGPDGTMVARDIRGQAIWNAVEKALGKITVLPANI